MEEAYIYDAVRTPRGRGKADGKLHTVQPVQLLSYTLAHLRDRNHLDTTLIDDVVMGCVTPLGEQGANIARTAVLAANYNKQVAGVQMNRFCASGLESINTAAAYVMAGQADLIIGGGVESMSRVTMGTDGGALMMSPTLVAQHNIVPQGISADLIATTYGYTRQQADEFAATSHKKAHQATQAGFFAKSLVPYTDNFGTTLLINDEGIRSQTTAESLLNLSPAFETMGKMSGLDALALLKYQALTEIRHIHHAGNSSQISDGAAAMLIGNKTIGATIQLKPRAKFRAFGVVGSDPTMMLTGPVPATQKVLKRAGMTITDIDLFEVNEAFAVIPMLFIDQLGIDDTKVNPNGGAIAMGHPLGATGTIILMTLLDELERQDKTIGLATLCIGGGMGIATIIERV